MTTARKLFGWLDKRYNEEYWGRLQRNWRQWKEKQEDRRRMLEIIQEKREETEQKELEIREWTKEDKDKMDNIVDPYYELYFLRIRNLERGVVSWLSKWLSHYLFFFFLLDLLHREECGKVSHHSHMDGMSQCHVTWEVWEYSTQAM